MQISETQNNLNQYLACILEKHVISENTYIFTHICSQVGFIEDEIFIDKQNQEFPTIKEPSALYSSLKYFYASAVPVNESFKYFKLEKNDLQQLMTIYNTQLKNMIYYVYVDANDQVIMSRIDEHNLAQQVVNFTIRQRSSSEDQDLDWKHFLDKIKNNEFTKEELIEIRKQVIQQRTVMTEICNLIQIKIDDKKYLNNDELNKLLENEWIKQTKLNQKKINEQKKNDMIKINDTFKKVTKTLIAQDEPAKRLITELSRMSLQQVNNNAILLTGPTGVGKTKLMSLIAKATNRPFISVDSTQLTIPGYEGKNIDNYLYELLLKCNGDIKKMERAIIFFDEIDKKGSKRKDDISGQGVLNILLKFLDGVEYTFSTPDKQYVKVDTSKMLIIAGGAFQDVYSSEKKKPIGFNEEKINESAEPCLNDFIEKAMMSREFMARFPIIIRMNDLDRESMKNILLTSDESPLKNQQAIFETFDVSLNFTDKAIDKIAEKAISEHKGARGLNGIVLNSTCKCFEYATENYEKIDAIIVTEETVEDANKFIIKNKAAEQNLQAKEKKLG